MARLFMCSTAILWSMVALLGIRFLPNATSKWGTADFAAQLKIRHADYRPESTSSNRVLLCADDVPAYLPIVISKGCVPILGPLTFGGAPYAIAPPSNDEMARAWEKATSIMKPHPDRLFRSESRLVHVEYSRELLRQYIDPERVIPLIGPCVLHHADYRCNITYWEATTINTPTPYTLIRKVPHIFYIDHNHFHSPKLQKDL